MTTIHGLPDLRAKFIEGLTVTHLPQSRTRQWHREVFNNPAPRHHSNPVG
jgi:hypothetical protein